jgi:hypothetical protein
LEAVRTQKWQKFPRFFAKIPWRGQPGTGRNWVGRKALKFKSLAQYSSTWKAVAGYAGWLQGTLLAIISSEHVYLMRDLEENTVQERLQGVAFAVSFGSVLHPAGDTTARKEVIIGKEGLDFPEWSGDGADR